MWDGLVSLEELITNEIDTTVYTEQCIPNRCTNSSYRKEFGKSDQSRAPATRLVAGFSKDCSETFSRWIGFFSGWLGADRP